MKQNFYSISNTETYIHDIDTDSVIESIYSTIMNEIWKYQAEDSSWIVDSLIEQTMNISKYRHLTGSSYIKLPKEFHHLE